MEALDSGRVLEKLCAATKKWGLYISIFLPEKNFNMGEVCEACSFLNWDEHAQIIADQEGWFLFDAREECETAFWQCVGDDGPTHLNPYNDRVRVYALTCSPEGQLMNENT